MNDVTTRPHMPRKVLAKAVQLGVHNDCVLSTADKACASCRELINLSFDYYYGDAASLGDLMDLIMGDLRRDREDDLS